MSYKFNQAPKELEAQCAAFKKANPTLPDLGSPYWMQPKFDGCLAIVIPDEDRIITRTGELVRSLPHVLEYAHKMFPGKVLFGEAYRFNTPFPAISGKFRRHTTQADLFVALFDAVPYDDWKAGACATPYRTRYQRIRDVVDTHPSLAFIVAPVQVCDNPDGFAKALVALGGYDGAIIRKIDAPWAPGASKNGEVIKVKPVLSLDLKCVGWFVGKGKYANSAGGITVEHKGTRTDVGTGFSDEDRRQIYSGKFDTNIAEIEFMGFTSDGKLREPRFKSWRYDKTKPD